MKNDSRTEREKKKLRKIYSKVLKKLSFGTNLRFDCYDVYDKNRQQ